MLDPRIESGIRAQLQHFPHIAAAWVFGSMARGTAGSGSDLDVAVLLSGSGSSTSDSDAERSTIAIDELLRLSVELERFSPSGRVDIVVLGQQGPVFRHRVLSEGQLVKDADPELRFDFEGRTIAEYIDWKPTHDIAMASAMQGLIDRFQRQRKP